MCISKSLRQCNVIFTREENKRNISFHQLISQRKNGHTIKVNIMDRAVYRIKVTHSLINRGNRPQEQSLRRLKNRQRVLQRLWSYPLRQEFAYPAAYRPLAEKRRQSGIGSSSNPVVGLE